MLRVWKSDSLSVFIPDYNGRIYTWLQPSIQTTSSPRFLYEKRCCNPEQTSMSAWSDTGMRGKPVRRCRSKNKQRRGRPSICGSAFKFTRCTFLLSGERTSDSRKRSTFVSSPCEEVKTRHLPGVWTHHNKLHPTHKHILFQSFTHERRGAWGLTLGLSQKHQSDTLTKIKPLKSPPSWKSLSHCYLHMYTRYSFRGFAYIYLLFLKTAFVCPLNLPGFKLLSLTQVIQS